MGPSGEVPESVVKNAISIRSTQNKRVARQTFYTIPIGPTTVGVMGITSRGKRNEIPANSEQRSTGTTRKE